jgi:hypothetical protein
LEVAALKRILMSLSERSYWGEGLVGPVETFDAKGYEKANQPVAGDQVVQALEDGLTR